MEGEKEARILPPVLDVLKQRYVTGEINKEEYEQKRKDLPQ